MTSPADPDTGDDSHPGAAPGDRVTLPAAELEALRARVAEWDALFDDSGLQWNDGEDVADGLQTNRSIATWIVQLVFPRLSFAHGWRLATQRRLHGERCLAWTFPMSPDGSVVDDGKDDPLWVPEDRPFAPDRVMDLTLIGTMGTLQGDGSLEAYIEAAVLYRELAELGSRGREDPWRGHRIVDTNPFIAAGLYQYRSDGPGPGSGLWAPEATRDDSGAVVVCFWTVPTVGELRVLGHRYTFLPGTMRIDEGDDLIFWLSRQVDRPECWWE